MPVVMEVPAGTTSTILPFTPFLNFTVDVDAVYAPPPDGDRVFIPLLPSTTFTTPQRRKEHTVANSILGWGLNKKSMIQCLPLQISSCSAIALHLPLHV